jgi:hypothetical protein
VNVGPNATSPQVNQVSVSGGGSAGAAASDPTVIATSAGLGGDFDGNSSPDVLWVNQQTGQVALWLLGGPTGTSVQGFAWLNGTLGWGVVATADFDRNGKPDLIWRNGSTGQVAVWLMGGATGTAVQGFAWLNATGDPAWTVAGAADLDSNGTPDIVWQKEATREAVVWYMGGAQGTTVTGFAWLCGANPGWRIVALTDFDGSGVPDVVWQNDTTRVAAIWYMGGTGGLQVTNFAWVASTGGQGTWRIVGANDFDRTGKPDFVWQDEVTGNAAVWLMGGALGNQVQGFAWLQQGSPVGWRVVIAR